MKPSAMFLMLLLFCVCFDPSREQSDSNTTCTVTVLDKEELTKRLAPYFGKDSPAKVLEYQLKFVNASYTYNNTFPTHSYETWRWFRTQDYGPSFLFFVLDGLSGLFDILFSHRSSMEIVQLKDSPLNCLRNLTASEKEMTIRNILISDFGINEDNLQKNIERSKKVNICLNYKVSSTFKEFRCCGFNSENEITCVDLTSKWYLHWIYDKTPFFAAIIIGIYTLYLYFISFKNVTQYFVRVEARQTTWEEKKPVRNTSTGNDVSTYMVYASDLMHRETTQSLPFLYISQMMKDKLSCCKSNSVKKTSFPSAFSLFPAIIIWFTPFVFLFKKLYEQHLYDKFAFLSVHITLFLIHIIIARCLVSKQYLCCGKKKTCCNICFCLYLVYIFFIYYCLSIILYVKIVLAATAFFIFEFKTIDIYLSIAFVILVYLYDFISDLKTSLGMCLERFEYVLTDIIHRHRSESNTWEDIIKLHFEDRDLRNGSLFTHNQAAVFYDLEGKMNFSRRFFYKCCSQYRGKKQFSGFNVSKVLLAVIGFAYLLMIGATVLYFNDLNDYSSFESIFTIISAGMLPKVITKFGTKLFKGRTQIVTQPEESFKEAVEEVIKTLATKEPDISKCERLKQLLKSFKEKIRSIISTIKGNIELLFEDPENISNQEQENTELSHLLPDVENV
ncbi:uncharacterized protein LOC131938189 [Physella acuta]|uniref:uncharacterized protein LOC131938189 n=1 Tax=Physella acuta TaxID=109671 RepID=UPI0027DCBB94|nr:uncharacterized protein LOC131938189 [Physella acuta]